MPMPEFATHDYSFGGLRVRSDIVLPGLVAASSEPGPEPELRLTAEAGAPLLPDRVCYTWRQGYRLELATLWQRVEQEVPRKQAEITLPR